MVLIAIHFISLGYTTFPLTTLTQPYGWLTLLTIKGRYSMTKLTQKLVLNHVLPISGYQIIWCSSLPGFGVRLSSGGKRSYVAQYVCRASRRSRRATLGDARLLSYQLARVRAKELMATNLLAKPAKVERVPMTVSEGIEWTRRNHIDHLALGSQRMFESAIRIHVPNEMRNKVIDDVTKG
jgi:hypothetical protein